MPVIAFSLTGLVLLILGLALLIIGAALPTWALVRCLRYAGVDRRMDRWALLSWGVALGLIWATVIAAVYYMHRTVHGGAPLGVQGFVWLIAVPYSIGCYIAGKAQDRLLPNVTKG